MNIQNFRGCGGQNLRVALDRDGRTCSTNTKASFGDGATLLWTDSRLGNCRDFKIDHRTKFSLQVVGSSDPFCPVLVKFITSKTSYLSRLDLEYRSTPWYSNADNYNYFYVDPIVEQDFTCPHQAQGCPIHELRAMRRSADKYKQCIFK